MIDSHCHLADKVFDEDRDAVIERAKGTGVTHMVCIGDTIEESEKCVELIGKYEQLLCTVGVHPHEARAFKEGDIELLKALAQSSDNVRAIGEIGLDYHYDHSPRDVQRVVFRAQLELAKDLNLPAVIHSREAIEDTWEIVSGVNPEKLVLHCCTEKFEDVERFLDHGYLLSFTGIATYTNAEEVHRTIAKCPLEHMMIETDAPYLAPIPYRGKRNEPAFVLEIAKCVAELKGVTLEEVDEVTTRTTLLFYS
jgi:TatD DNase family protein